MVKNSVKLITNPVLVLVVMLISGGVLWAGGTEDTTIAQQQEQPELDSYEASLTAAQLRQYQALMQAIHDDDIEAARTALAGGYILPNRGTVSARSPLFEAGSIGKPKFVSLLLESGANPQVMVKVIDSIRGSVEYIAHALYISIKAQRNYAEKGEEYPLDATRDEKLSECLRLFLEAGADPNILSKSKVVPGDEFGAMRWMAAIGNTEAMALLQQYGGDVNLPAYGTTFNPFTIASNKDHYETIEWLLDHGLDVHQEDERGRTPLDSGDIEVVKMFLDRDLIDPKTRISLGAAISNDDLEFANRLLELGVDVNRSYSYELKKWRDGMPMNTAIYQHSPKWVNFLLENGADPCLVSFKGRTAYEEIRRRLGFKSKNKQIVKEQQQVLALLEQHKPESECQSNRVVKK